VSYFLLLFACLGRGRSLEVASYHTLVTRMSDSARIILGTESQQLPSLLAHNSPNETPSNDPQRASA